MTCSLVIDDRFVLGLEEEPLESPGIAEVRTACVGPATVEQRAELTRVALA